MADFIVESRMWLPKPRVEVFAFFADPVNVPSVMPPSLRVRLGASPPAMAAGAVFDLRLVWLGVPLRWRAFVREYDPPVRFLDVQVRGPYARWEHRHLFLVDGEGTRVEERVVYRLPFGPLGRLAHTVLIGRQLATLWAYRRQRISHVLGPVLDVAP